MNDHASPTSGTVPTFPDEVVTHALARYVNVPGLDGEIALITLENGHDHKRPTTFGPAGLSSLDEALDAVLARTPAVRAIAVTGKPYVFAVGADLTGIPRIRSEDDARAIAQLGHRVFGKLRDAGVPTFAFVNGAAMGGGLELALHCDYRTISAGAAAIALPECFLGIVPGWGGSYLLPNLIGVENALRVIVENPLSNNKMLRAKQALELGIADVLFAPADFLEASLRWAAAVVRGEVSVARPEIERGEAWDITVLMGRKIVDARLHGAAPSYTTALDLVALAKDATYAEAMAAEEDALTALLLSPQLRAGLYAFDLTQKRARKPAGVPDASQARPVSKVGIVGAGLMASQLAVLFARRLQVPVVLTDVDGERLEAGVARARADVDKLYEKKRIDRDTAARVKALITGSPDLAAFADADFVIEAVFEDIEVKHQVFADVEAVVRPDCVLATNTSSLSVGGMAKRLGHPERLVGFHFFNPVAVLPLVEVVRTPATDDASLATAFALGKKLKKSCVLVSDAPAFVVNRLLIRCMGEILRALDHGASAGDADSALDPLGLPMSPLELLELVGPPIALHVTETLHAVSPDRFPISPTLRAAVELGKGSLLVRRGGEKALDPDIAAAVAPERAGEHDVDETPPGSGEIRERALAALAEEISLMLDEGVVGDARDIDLCMILGAGWPFHLGGITPYLDHSGVAERVTGRRLASRST